MPDAKYDHVLACQDFNVMGENCPFYSGGNCNILGWSNPEPIPEDGVCNKGVGVSGPVSKHTILLFDLSDEYEKELKRLQESDAYKRFKEAVEHYAKPEVQRLAQEYELLKDKVAGHLKGGISDRHFKKRFKPNGVGVTPNEAPSFRMRVLEHLRSKIRNLFNTERQPTKDELKEKVALQPRLERERWLDEMNTEQVDEWWDPGFLTKGTDFEDEWQQSGIDCWDGLGALFQEHEGKKILVEVKFHYSPGGYYNPHDIDYYIEDINLLKVLDG